MTGDHQWQHGSLCTIPVSKARETILLRDIISREVRNPQGEALAIIEDLVVTPNDGRIEYLRLRTGSDNPRTVMVPWSQFQISEDKNNLVLPVSKSSLHMLSDVHQINALDS